MAMFDKVLFNETWLARWPSSSYLSSTPRTYYHLPLVLQVEGRAGAVIVKFDNYLDNFPGFLSSVSGVRRHHIHGTSLYLFTRKTEVIESNIPKATPTEEGPQY